MTNRKKIFAGLCLPLLIFFLLKGLLLYSSHKPQPTKAEANGDKIVITYWRHHHREECRAMQELIEKFEKEHENIEVRLLTFPYNVYTTKLVATLSAGEGPDLINIHNSWAYSYIKAGLIVPVPLDMFPDKGMDEKFFPLARSFEFHGMYYGIPIGGGNLALFYNRRLFAEKGIENPPKTWSELVEMSQKLTKHENGRLVQSGVALGLPTGQGWNYFVDCVLRQAGTKIISKDYRRVAWDNERGVKALTWYTDFIKKHRVYSQMFPEDYHAFRLGLAAMIVNGNWGVGNLEKTAGDIDFATAPLPTSDNGIKATYGSCWGNCVTARADEKTQRAAWEFVEFITSYENMKFWANRTGELPMRRELLQDNDFITSHPRLAPFAEQMEYSYFSVKKDETAYKDAISNAIDEIIYNDMQPREALDMAAKKINSMLEKK